MNNSNLINCLSSLVSEEPNPATLDIDQLSTFELVTKINQQDELVSLAIKRILPSLAEAVDLIVEGFQNGGRLIYQGAGTSGRLGVLDAVECVPTFSVDEGMVVGVMAGGEAAMFKAKEGIEDQESEGVADLKRINLTEKDVLVGIAASGRTPYVKGGLKYANQIGATTIALSCNANAEIAKFAKLSLLPIVGPEVLAGSTRLKSGTAQKMALNILSTASMIRIGKSYKNLMVDLRATNEKLVARGTRMIMQVTGVELSVAEEALALADNQVKLALVMILKEVTAEEAKVLLSDADGFLAKVLSNPNSG